MSGKGFKGSLSGLYHENRMRIKGMKTRQLENKARREKETEIEDAQVDAGWCGAGGLAMEERGEIGSG